MSLVLTFALALIGAVLLSRLASRSVLSTAVLFLVVGVVGGATGTIDITAQDGAVAELIRVALFAVLFTDALRVGLDDLRSAYRLPGRALLFGMPLVFGAVAALAGFLVGLPWAESLLIGAVLAPTDPVLSSAIVGREGVPARLRRLLNVESGLNDGLALPVVLVLLNAVGGEGTGGVAIAAELVAGIAIGIAVPWLMVRLLRFRYLSAAGTYEKLNGFAIGLLVFAVAETVHANLFLAAFAAGTTVATAGPEVRNAFQEFGEPLTELLKLLALLLFGALLPLETLVALPWEAYLFAVLVLVAARPLSIGAALLGSSLDRWERVAAAWFGPKGFASVVYALLVLRSGVDGAEEIFTLAALVIAGSIVAHSSTDVVIARAFRESEDPERGLVQSSSASESADVDGERSG